MSPSQPKAAPKTGIHALEDLSVVKAVMNEFKKCRRFWNGCAKPSPAEYRRLLIATGIGVVASGSLGYAVKALSYPIFRALSERA